MKKLVAYFLTFIVFWIFKFGTPSIVEAIYDPLSTNNNKIGIHILDPNEIDKVFDLVNSSGGDWGYVTVPLRSDDRIREKWFKFFQVCQEKHLIPIIRLATTMNSYGWQRPDLYDSLDAANFLNDMPWPTENRYIVVYNEPNHSGEWGGTIDPVDYARVLKHTSLIFKQRNQNFFILPAGLDAAAPSSLPNHEDLYRFVWQMRASYPDVFEYIDGWASHAYPNPGFSGLPSDRHKMSVYSFNHEVNFISNFTVKNLPIFITETGWNQEKIGEGTAASFFQSAFGNVWNDNRIVAVTPFLLSAGQGDFKKFSFLEPGGSKKNTYFALKEMNKVSGAPKFEEKTLFAQVLGATDYYSQENLTSEAKMDVKRPILPKEKWAKIFSWLWYTNN